MNLAIPVGHSADALPGPYTRSKSRWLPGEPCMLAEVKSFLTGALRNHFDLLGRMKRTAWVKFVGTESRISAACIQRSAARPVGTISYTYWLGGRAVVGGGATSFKMKLGSPIVQRDD